MHYARCKGVLLELRKMPETTKSEKPNSMAGVLGAGMGSAVRVLRDKDQSKRLFKGFLAGGWAFLRSVGKVAHMLFLEVTGFIFVCFATVGGFAAFREYKKYAAGETGPGHVIVAGLFTLMFAYFGLTSFWKARK